MDDEFEVELRIDQLGKAYAIASGALQRARYTLESLRAEASTKPELIAKAEQRCDQLVRRRATLRRMLDELEDQAVPGVQARSVAGRSLLL
jgi:hypothetical protein